MFQSAFSDEKTVNHGTIYHASKSVMKYSNAWLQGRM